MYMKKFILTVFIAIVATSCVKEEYYDSMDMFEIQYTVYDKDWRLNDNSNGTFFYFDFQEKNLNKQMFLNGNFNGFILNKDLSLTPMPFIVFEIENGYKWTEQYTCNFNEGNIRFIVTYNDFEMSMKPPTMDFIVKYFCKF